MSPYASLEAICAYAIDARDAGDPEMVRLCGRAIAGDLDACALVTEMIATWNETKAEMEVGGA